MYLYFPNVHMTSESYIVIIILYTYCFCRSHRVSVSQTLCIENVNAFQKAIRFCACDLGRVSLSITFTRQSYLQIQKPKLHVRRRNKMIMLLQSTHGEVYTQSKNSIIITIDVKILSANVFR